MNQNIYEQNFSQLNADQQLRLCTEIMDQERQSGWPLQKRFKNPERLLRYYRHIKIPLKTIIINHNINPEILNHDQPQLSF